MVTSDEILDREFTVVMRGYERHEVDEHLRAVAADASRLAARVEELERRVLSAESGATPADPSDGFRALGEETTRILVAAETAAREMREKAERQADAELAAAERAARERVETASEHASAIVAEAEERRAEIEAAAEARRLSAVAEVARLQEVEAQLLAKLRAAIGVTTEAIGDLQAPAPTPAAAPSPVVAEPEPVEPEPEPVSADPEPEPEPESEPASEPEPEPEPESEPASEPEPEPASEPEPAAEPEPEPEPATQPKPAVAEPEPAPAADEAHHGADRGAIESAITSAAVAAGREDAPAPASARDTEPGLLRERSLAGIRPGMLRRLRRGVQELQNGVLEGVRTREEGADVDRMLPDAGSAASLSDIGRVFLDAGYRAGRADAPVLRGGGALTDPPTDARRVASAADLLADELLAELRTTLAPSLRAGVDAGEPDASLSERVSEVFRDLKGPVIETVVDRHLTKLYGEATLDGWASTGVTHVVWVLGDETRCPEGMCRANEAEGPVELGTDFPSGHATPLTHEGCTCALAPA